MTPEQAFDVLAEAAQVRHPNPDRENRGLCPAHSDQNNPALVFRIGDTGNLVAYCHSQHCTIESLARAIGVETAGFFADSNGRFTQAITIDWQHQPVLDLLKMMPFEYDHDDLVECAFRTLDLDLDYADQPLKGMTKTDMLTLGHIWMAPGYDYTQHGDWWNVYHVFLGQLQQLDRETRIDPDAMVNAIPRGSM